MSGYRELPAPARRVMVGFALLGLGSVAIRIPQLASWSWTEVVTALALAVAAAVSEQFTVAVSHQTETENFSVTDALWVPALILAPPSVLTVGVLVGTLAGHAFRRWSWYKVLFNASQFVVAITAAELVYALFVRAFSIPEAFVLMTWVACVVAMACYLTINELAVALIISRVEDVSLRRIVMLPGGLNLLHAAGNLTIGMLAALVWRTGPVGLPLLVAPIFLSFFAYRGWLQNKREEEQRREGERMRTLYEAGRALFGPLDAGFDFKPFLALVRTLVDAAGADLVLRDGSQLNAYSSESGRYLTVEVPEDAPGDGQVEPATYVGNRPGLSTYLAPVVDDDDEVGVLAVHRAVELSESERSLVDALASQVSARQRNQQLFAETVEQRGHLADVVGSSSDGIFVVSTEGTVLSWNPAMERITGFDPQEVVGARLEEIVRIEDEFGADGEFALGAHEQQDALLRRRDGSARWIRYSSSQMPHRDGTGSSHVVTARDVTAELEAEQMKSDFIATVSHELRTPLTPLKGLLQSLEQGLVEDTPETRREYDAIMLRQTERLEHLINDLLEVSRIDAGKLSIDASPLELVATLTRDVEDAAALTGERGIDFEEPGHPVWVHADRFRVGQIVSNLISNAFKYTPADAPVVVRLRVVEDQAVIAVQDAGEGIAVAEQEKVFDRFFRSDSDVSRTAGGFGLGLYIARQLTEAMGGRLILTSELGQGCTFSLNLPLLELDAPAGQSSTALETV
jgi:PAS domain S-box-containing protein